MDDPANSLGFSIMDDLFILWSFSSGAIQNVVRLYMIGKQVKKIAIKNDKKEERKEK